ncbi:MAG: flagellar motor switch protein FliN [Planctomycetes bacterium]|nr:flagellar motor switch protein FliN [Planctomycetota bacterium]
MADDSDQVGQDEIEALLRQAQNPGGEAAPPPEPEPAAPEEDDSSVDQDEIEALLNGGAMPAAPVAQASPVATAVAAPPAGASPVSPNDIELLLNKAEQALESIDQAEPQTVLPPGIRNFDFEKFGGTAANTDSATLELMRDVQLDMTIELGRTHMQLEELLKLRQGAVVPLDKLAGDPADIYVNGRLVARGEVLVLNDNFCIRVAELIEGENAVA